MHELTATEILRRLLDERGVEHYDGTERTLWGYEQTGEDTGIYRFAASEISGGFLQFDMFRITPEQAIAATLGVTDATGVRKGGVVPKSYIRTDEEGSICPVPKASVIFEGQKLTFDEEDSARFAEIVKRHFRELAGLEVGQ